MREKLSHNQKVMARYARMGSIDCLMSGLQRMAFEGTVAAEEEGSEYMKRRADAIYAATLAAIGAYGRVYDWHMKNGDK